MWEVLRRVADPLQNLSISTYKGGSSGRNKDSVLGPTTSKDGKSQDVWKQGEGAEIKASKNKPILGKGSFYRSDPAKNWREYM